MAESLSWYELADIFASEKNLVKRAASIDARARAAILRRFDDLFVTRQMSRPMWLFMKFACWYLRRSHAQKGAVEKSQSEQAEMLSEAKTKESTNG